MKKKILLFITIYFVILSIPIINLNYHTSTPTFSILKNKKTISSKDVFKNKDKNKIKHTHKKQFINKEEKQLKELSEIINSYKLQPDTSSLDIDYTIPSDGFFNILNIKTNEIDRISEKDYVIGAVCAEMPPTFHPEALKAQAISAHTYALKMKKDQQFNPDPTLKGADFSADPTNWNKYVTEQIAKERFENKFDEYWSIIKTAAEDVIDVVMLYNDEPIIAAYHAICGGKTESAHNIWGGDAPYLLPIESYGDNFAPGYKSTATFSSKEVKNILNDNFPEILLPKETFTWFDNINYSDSGSVLNVTINDNIISGNKLRNLFKLRSLNFKIDYNPKQDSFTFFVKGYGHGIGLSQYGADYMAKNGSSYDEILKHYYSDISFAHVSNVY